MFYLRKNAICAAIATFRPLATWIQYNVSMALNALWSIRIHDWYPLCPLLLSQSFSRSFCRRIDNNSPDSQVHATTPSCPRDIEFKGKRICERFFPTCRIRQALWRAAKQDHSEIETGCTIQSIALSISHQVPIWIHQVPIWIRHFQSPPSRWTTTAPDSSSYYCMKLCVSEHNAAQEQHHGHVTRLPTWRHLSVSYHQGQTELRTRALEPPNLPSLSVLLIVRPKVKQLEHSMNYFR